MRCTAVVIDAWYGSAARTASTLGQNLGLSQPHILAWASASSFAGAAACFLISSTASFAASLATVWDSASIARKFRSASLAAREAASWAA